MFDPLNIAGGFLLALACFLLSHYIPRIVRDVREGARYARASLDESRDRASWERRRRRALTNVERCHAEATYAGWHVDLEEPYRETMQTFDAERDRDGF